MSHRRKGLAAALVLGFVLLIFPPDAFSALSSLPDTPSVTVTALAGDPLSSGQDINATGYAFAGGATTLDWGASSSWGGNASSNWWGHNWWGHNWRRHRNKPPPCPTPVVPIPNAAWLLGSGVVALFVLKRKRPTA